MKANKNIILILSLTLALSNNLSYASEEYTNQINPAIEENNADSATDKLADEIVKEKEKLINFIEDFKKSTNYLDCSDQIRILYDNSIIFNSRALEQNNYEWLIFSNRNLKEDIEIIESLSNNDFQNKENINVESIYYNNPLFKIAYLKLDKSEKDFLDELSKENNEIDLLKISDFTKTENDNLLIFFSDWLYPFIDDEDKDGVITSSQALLDSIKEDEILFENYRNTSYDERNKLYDKQININDDIDKSNLNLINLLTANYQNKQVNDEELANNNDKLTETFHKPETVVLGEDESENISDSESSKVTSENIEKTNDFKDSEYEYGENNLVTEDTIKSDNSIFSTHEKTKEAYAKLTDAQKQKLNEMNTDGKYPLTIDEVKKSGEFEIPVKSDVWIYPFMIDRNNSEEDILVNTNISDGSIFSTHPKTSEAYAKLTDDQKRILNEMNTDGKYPLTIAEVRQSGLFTIPVKSDKWIYPFMIDRNNSGEVGEYDGEFDDMEPGISSSTSSDTSVKYAVSDSPQLINENEIYTNPSPVENNVITSSPEPVNYTQTTSPSINTVQYYNVKTGIKGLRPIFIVLIAGSIAYYFMKKNSKNKN